jgi:putative membrane protein
MHYNNMMNGPNSGWGFVMGLFWLLFLAVMVMIVIHVLKHHDHTSDNIHHASPLDIAKQRYAKGEITKEEFDQLKKDVT